MRKLEAAEEDNDDCDDDNGWSCRCRCRWFFVGEENEETTVTTATRWWRRMSLADNWRDILAAAGAVRRARSLGERRADEKDNVVEVRDDNDDRRRVSCFSPYIYLRVCYWASK